MKKEQLLKITRDMELIFSIASMASAIILLVATLILLKDEDDDEDEEDL